MVKIRLRRTGSKKKPSYRVVVADSRTPRDGRFIEIVGHYNPRREPSIVKIHEDRVLYWLNVGAQPTDSVKRLLKNLGTLDRFARLKQGADLEELLAEAAATHQEEQANGAEAKKAQPAEAPAKAEAEEPEAEEEAVAETEAPAQEESADADAEADTADSEEDSEAEAPSEEETKA